MTNNSRPARNRPTCPDCHRVLTKANRTSALGSDLCDDCFHIAGLYNEHQDGMHEDEPVADCEGCGHVIADRSKPSTTRTSKGRFDHSPCYAKGHHDKSREGRATCRNAGGPKA